MRDIRGLLPETAAGYRGSRGALRFLIAANVVTTARSLVHMLAPDGGMRTIARIESDGDGDRNLVAITGQWGLEQLLLAFVAWVAIIRYRALVPFVLLLHLLDLVGRIGVGRLKPLTSTRTPPGKIGQFVALPFVAIALWRSLPKRRTPRAERSTEAMQ